MKKKRLPIASPRGPEPSLGPRELAAIAESEAIAVARALRSSRSPETPGALAATAAERAESLTREALAREAAPPPIACVPGCPSCCASKVLVIAPEIVRIAEHLRATLEASELAALLERVDEAAQRTRGLSRIERAKSGVTCPLLVDRSCSVHAVRPIVCRAWTSFDRAGCERHFVDPEAFPLPPRYEAQYELGNAVLAGLGKGAVLAGLEGAPLELIAALRIALRRPNAAERWLQGLPVFSTARDAEWLEAIGRR